MLEIKNLTRQRVPRFAHHQIIGFILPDWDISLVFVTPAKARSLNESLRDKAYTPNVLSYAAGEKSGEIIICLATAKKQAPEFGLSADDFVLLLFIHALLHLKGLPHGATMEKRERKLLAKFVRGRAESLLNETQNNHRH